jgi:dihydropyrimidine dehydrogenase (NAD+) subunit PreA
LYKEKAIWVGQSVDLGVTAVGLKFENPFILASAPPTAGGDLIRKAFARGWAGAVIKTIKPDELNVSDVSPRFETIRGDDGAIIGFENFELLSKKPVAYWVEEIAAIKRQYPNKVLIASIMADLQEDSWQNLALTLQNAGSDALELNFSCPHGMPEQGIGSAIGQDPRLTGMITGWVKRAVGVPVIVKLSPNVTDIQLLARAAVDAGADAITAINTVQCLIGVDLETLTPRPVVDGLSAFGGYSGPAIKPIGLRCVAQIAQCVDVPILGVGGVCKWSDAAEYLALGAALVQVCTGVMLQGFGIIDDLTRQFELYLKSKGFSSPQQIKGVALKKVVPHEQLSRRYVVRAKVDDGRCTLCGDCLRACSDSGYQAISMAEKTVVIDEDKCDGCSLCSLVCSQQAISLAGRGQQNLEAVI